MLLRSRVISGVFALAAAMGCGPVHTEAEFEPLDESNSAAGTAAAVGGSGGQAVAGSGGKLEAATAGAAPVVGGAGGTGGQANEAGATGAHAEGGRGGAPISVCATLTSWQLAPYQLGARVRSTCLAPYNGSCPVSETHEFECRPPTGAVGLGWCTDRQPGVVNGWGEAWIMHGVCPAL